MRSPHLPHQTINGIEKKYCYHCKEWLPLLYFPASARSSDGLQAWCRACHAKYQTPRNHERSIQRRRGRKYRLSYIRHWISRTSNPHLEEPT